MQHFLNRITAFILRMPCFLLFLLIILKGFMYREPSSLGHNATFVINLLLQSLGAICFCAWIYAIGYTANKKLISHGVHVPLAKYFNFSILTLIPIYIVSIYYELLIDIPDRFSIWIGENELWLFKKEPYAIIFGISMFVAISIASKLLVAAEKIRGLQKGSFIRTFLLISLAPVGLWWVQPRAQKFAISS